MEQNIATLIEERLDDPAVAWSLGAFGAIAEFMWQIDERTLPSAKPLTRVTSRGALAIRLPDQVQAIDYTTPSRHSERRSRGTALCVPIKQAEMARRAVVTEVGPDTDALREEDRTAILFDVGLDLLHVDAMVRASDPETIALLREAVGRSIFDPAQTLMREMPRLSPHRVFTSSCGRIEVYQPIPPVEGRSPDGPHTHVLPRLLAHKRTHAANIDLPIGLVPCLSIHGRPHPDHARDE